MPSLPRVRLPKVPLVSSLPGLGSLPRIPGIPDPRQAVTERMRSMFEVSRFPQEQYTEPEGDPGLFGPGSVTWKIHGDPAMIVGGISALMLQSLHPLAMAGVADHSDYRQAPLRRLSRTASFIGATTFGSTPVAEGVINTVKGVHRRIVGTAPDGRPYSANDPDLLRWVHVAEVACFYRSYKRFGLGVVSPADGDRYFAETSTIAERLGATDVPRSRAEVASYFRAVRPELVAGEQAMDALKFIRTPAGNGDPIGRAAYDLIIRASVGVLPPWVRAMLGLSLPWPLSTAEQAIVAPTTWGVLRALRLATGAPPAIAEAYARCG